jgi:hypothetical protein
MHTNVSRLRRVVEPEASRWSRHGVLSSTGGGYVLSLPPAGSDVALFERSVANGAKARATGDLVGASDLLVEALRRWRGQALGGLSGSLLDARRRGQGPEGLCEGSEVGPRVLCCRHREVRV